MGWFARWRGRQRELAAGVDADLIEDNRQRWKRALRLFALAVVLALIYAKAPHPVDQIAGWLAFGCFIAAMFVAEWARGESAFLNKPDPPEPPSLWKFRSRR